MGSYDDLYDVPREKYFAAYDTSFVAGDSPVVHDIKATLLTFGIDGYIYNFGAGDLTFEISHDGTNYGNSIYLAAGDLKPLKSMRISKIRVTWVADTKYEVFAQ